MSFPKKITDSVYAVGVTNPNLRIFDIVMETKYGTSYNAYLIKGEKTPWWRLCTFASLRNIWRT